MKTLLLLIAFSSPVLAQCDVVDALQAIRPGSQWNLSGNTYEGVIWNDATQVKPTKQEVLDALTACQSSDLTRKIQKAQARLDVKNTGLTQAQRLQALLIILDLDR